MRNCDDLDWRIRLHSARGFISKGRFEEPEREWDEIAMSCCASISRASS